MKICKRFFFHWRAHNPFRLSKNIILKLENKRKEDQLKSIGEPCCTVHVFWGPVRQGVTPVLRLFYCDRSAHLILWFETHWHSNLNFPFDLCEIQLLACREICVSLTVKLGESPMSKKWLAFTFGWKYAKDKHWF